MPVLWNKIHLGDVIDINPKSVGKKYPYDKILYVDISSVGTGLADSPVQLKLEKAPSRARRLVADGDTIISTVRPNRRSFLYIKNPSENLVVSTGFAVLHPKLINPRFLYYLVTNQSFTDYLTLHAKGAAYPAVDTDTISRAEVSIPSIDVQGSIVDVLASYDELIQNNVRRIQVLEQMAQAIYKEWFINFHFPGHEKKRLVDSRTDFGKIPEGWLGRIDDYIDYKEGPGIRNFQYTDSGIPFLNIRTLVDGEIDINKCNHLDPIFVKTKYAHFLLQENDMVVSSSGTIGRVAVVRKSHLPLCLNTSIIRMRSKNSRLGIWQLKYFLLSDYFQNQITAHAGGAAQVNYGPAHLQQMFIIAPDEKTSEKFEAIVAPMEETIKLLRDEKLNLIKSRDLLIPKLITGEIRV